MADQEHSPTPGGAAAPTPSEPAQRPAPAGAPTDDAAAALGAAQAAINQLKSEDAPPPPGGDDRAAAALQAAQEAIAAAKSVNGAQTAPGAAPAPVEMPELARGAARASAPTAPGELELLSDVNLHVKIELGRTRMLVEDVLRLGEGSVVELDKPAGDPVDVYVNDRHVARGEVLVVNENFCVRISEIIDGGTPGIGS